jgi:molybdopterin synthase catalytic subunit
MALPLLAITSATLDLAALVELVSAERAGAVASFLGTVRSPNKGRRVLYLEYEAYEPLAIRVFERIRDEMTAEWPEAVVALHHRIGRLERGEVSVAIAVSSPHRATAFAACRYAIERVKQIAPIWKRETFEGGEVWVEGAVATPDDEAARREALKLACV